MIHRVGIRELRNSVASVVRRASSGEQIVITVDGVPTAVLGPLGGFAGAQVTLDDLVAAGLLLPASRLEHPDAPEPANLPIDTRSSRVLGDLRGE